MPHLNPAHFRRLIHRRGEIVRVFMALPLSSRAAGEAVYQRGQTPDLGPGEAILHGYLYRPMFPLLGMKVWINGAARSRSKTAGGVMEGGENEVTWMPDEISLAAPDMIVRVNEEKIAQETTRLPLDGQPLELSRPYVFCVEMVSQGSNIWYRGQHFECQSAAPTLGVLSGGGVILSWLGPDRPAPEANIALRYRFHPALYFSGEMEQGGMRSRYGAPDSQSSLLPRNGKLSFIHPDAALQEGE